MHRAAVFLLIPFTFGGCLFNVRTGDTVPAESLARFPLRDRAVGLVEKLLSGDGWTGSVVAKTVEGRVSGNPGEAWSEDTIILDVAAKTPDDTAFVIPVDAYQPILTTLRRRIRDVVEDTGGEQLEYTFSETYHERSLAFRYKSGSVIGWVLVRVFPKSANPDEQLTRVEITIHEQPAPDQ